MRVCPLALLLVLTEMAVPLACAWWSNEMRQREIEQRLAQSLEDAARTGKTTRVGRLLDQGANIDGVTNGRFNWTPLMHASHNGHVETVRLLLGRGADVHHQCRDYSSALTLAQLKGHDTIESLLFAQGARQE